MNGYNESPSSTTSTVLEVINRLLDSEGLNLNDSHHVKQELRYNRFRPALFDVLCEMKHRFLLGNGSKNDEDVPDPQMIRLDNMLLAEGISAGAVGDAVSSRSFNQMDPTPSAPDSQVDQGGLEEHAEYRKKLAIIRARYLENLNQFEKDSGEFIGHILTLLQEQALTRPISQPEIERIIQAIRKKMRKVQQKIKQDTCEMVMLLRSRFLDARRKRRNFSKTATKVLNEYFYANLANPYPSEEAKEELARKCCISVSQVSNWFGNKRIRFKKNLGKSESK